MSNLSVGKGKLVKRSGINFTHNIDLTKKLSKKVGEGGRVAWLPVTRDENYINQDIGDNIDEEELFLRQLQSNDNFLAVLVSMTKFFVKPSADEPAPFQKFRKDSARAVATLCPKWTIRGLKRKVKTYAVPGAMLRLLKQMIDELGSRRSLELFESCFGSIEEFDKMLQKEMFQKVDMYEEIMSKNTERMIVPTIAGEISDDEGSEETEDLFANVDVTEEQNEYLNTFFKDILPQLETQPSTEVRQRMAFGITLGKPYLCIHPELFATFLNVSTENLKSVQDNLPATYKTGRLQTNLGRSKDTRVMKFSTDRLNSEVLNRLVNVCNHEELNRTNTAALDNTVATPNNTVATPDNTVATPTLNNHVAVPTLNLSLIHI